MPPKKQKIRQTCFKAPSGQTDHTWGDQFSTTRLGISGDSRSLAGLKNQSYFLILSWPLFTPFISPFGTSIIPTPRYLSFFEKFSPATATGDRRKYILTVFLFSLAPQQAIILLKFSNVDHTEKEIGGKYKQVRGQSQISTKFYIPSIRFICANMEHLQYTLLSK